MLVKACLNGPRDPGEHPALPMTAEALAADAVACARAGAGAIHVHPRDEEGRESLTARVVDPVVAHVAQAARVPVGVATGAWVEPDPERRAALVGAWRTPAFASVNLSEDGAPQVMRTLLDAGIGVEAGVWTVQDADRLAATGLASRLLRVLVEPTDPDGVAAAARARAIDTRLDAHRITAPRVHHGEGCATWTVIEQAIRLRHSTRIGLEDTLVHADGTPARSNAELVARLCAALRLAASDER